MQVESSTLPARARVLSAAELALGAFVVIGHNVLRLVPHEVPILVALAGLLSVRLRNRGGLAVLGFRRPASWGRIAAVALAAAALRLLLGEIVERFLAPRLGAVQAPEGASEITGNLGYALLALLIVWTFAALGEEIAYRGYLLSRGADALGGSTAAWWTSMVVVAVLFGIGHWYKGPVGVLDSGMAGLILGAAYLVSGRNLWVCVLAHGLIDTFGVIWLYFGWAS